MGRYFSEEIIEQIRLATDIVEVISRHVTLKRAGANFQACCPFHTEKTPSFSVSPKKQIFKCFGCGKAGNVFHFLMEISSLTFPEAVTKLAEENGIPLPISQSDGEGKKRRKDLLEIMRWATFFFQEQLKSPIGKEALNYLEQRQIHNSIIEKFQVGFAPANYNSLLNTALKEGFDEETLITSGLISQGQKGYYDRFRDRVIFPICNLEGKVIAFGGRILNDGKPKYLNSPETPVFLKKRTLYAFQYASSHIREGESLVITEGYTDTLMAHQHNFCQTVATLGTALTEDHTRIIRRYTDKVILVFDGDMAGQKAMTRSIGHFLSQNLALRVAILPENLDPCDLLIERGQDAFQSILDQSQDFLDFQLMNIAKRHDIRSTIGRRLALSEVANIVKQVPDRVTQRLLIGKISEFFRLPPELLVSEIFNKTKPKPVSQTVGMTNYREKLQREEEEFLIWVLLHYPDKEQDILKNYPPKQFRTPILNKIAEKIVSLKELDIAKLSSSVEPDLGKNLVRIYYDNYGEDAQKNDYITKRLQLIFKAVERRKYRTKLYKLKNMLEQISPEEKDFSPQILEDARKLCKEGKKNS